MNEADRDAVEAILLPVAIVILAVLLLLMAIKPNPKHVKRKTPKQ